jgi:hypothetical protein
VESNSFGVTAVRLTSFRLDVTLQPCRMIGLFSAANFLEPLLWLTSGTPC